MPAGPDWERVRRRLGQDWAGRVLDAVRSDEAYWRDRVHAPGPETETAWTHFYFCDDDGTRLTFDPATPSEHRCSCCGRVYRGGKWDGAWRTQMHTHVAAQSQRYALIARLSDDPEQVVPAVEAVAGIVEQYGNDYARYQRHGEHAGTGKVQPQSLDEAVWLITVLRSVRWTEDLLAPATLRAAEQLAAQAVELLRPQVSKIHNIHCWLLAAGRPGRMRCAAARRGAARVHRRLRVRCDQPATPRVPGRRHLVRDQPDLPLLHRRGAAVLVRGGRDSSTGRRRVDPCSRDLLPGRAGLFRRWASGLRRLLADPVAVRLRRAGRGRVRIASCAGDRSGSLLLLVRPDTGGALDRCQPARACGCAVGSRAGNRRGPGLRTGRARGRAWPPADLERLARRGHRRHPEARTPDRAAVRPGRRRS